MKLGPHEREAIDERPHLGAVVKRLSHAVTRTTTAALQPWGLTTAQYTTLRQIRLSSRCSAAGLARQCSVSPQSMALLLVTLEREGHITRRPAAVHPRVLEIRLSRSGAKVLLSAERAVGNAFSGLLTELGPDRSATLHDWLERAATALGRPPRPH
ncbi:MarR family winged helix-turn-helix transcriptional regulator [Streptacidiphilus sp. PAMC 29251]